MSTTPPKKREKTGGRKPKNTRGVRITFTPSDDVLAIYDSWENKTATLEAAILAFGKA